MSPVFDRLGESWGNLESQKIRFQSLFFVHFVAFSGVVIFRNVYLEEMGMSGSAMGQIGFLMTATGVVAQPVWGIVTDYLRAERPVLVAGAVVSALSLLVYPFADGLAKPFLIVAVGTAIFSVFHAPIVPIANGLVLSCGYDYGNIRAYGSVAFGIGSLGFGYLVATMGISSIVYVYVVGMVILVTVVWTISEVHTESDADDNEPSLSRALRTLLTNVNFLVVLLVAFVLAMSIRGGSAFFSVYMRTIGAEAALGPWTLSADALTGISWTVKTALETVAFVYAIRFTESYKIFLVVGGAAVTFPFVVYGVTTQPWVIVVVQVIGGIGYGLYTLAVVNLVYVIASERVTSTAQTVLTGVGLGFGGAVGQVVAGELTDLLGIQRMYLYVAVIGFIGATIGLFVSQVTTADRGDEISSE